jgi:putative hydrolase of the HAD superfamily
VSPVRAVFFDVDETLVDFDAAAIRAHTELFGALDGYDTWCELTPQFWTRFTSGELDFVAMREARMARYLELAGVVGDPGEYELTRWNLVEAGFETYPDVAACLTDLRQDGLLLGVVTNNESVHQRRKLATVGLADAFDVVAISGEVGFAKPDAAIFRYACAAIEVPPAEAMHVGDLLEVDAYGARDAGLHGVWLDRRGLRDGSERNVSVIAGLDDVARLVA